MTNPLILKTPIILKTAKLAALMAVMTINSACAVYRAEVPDSKKEFARLEARQIEVGAFETIYLRSDAYLRIRTGETVSVTLSTEPDHFEHLEVTVHGGELSVRHQGRHRGRRYVALEIVVPSLSGIRIEGAVDAELDDITADVFDLEIDGAGAVVINGTCNRADFRVDGYGSLEAFGFHCHDVRLRFSGIGSAEVWADEKIDLDVSGIGSVDVRGKPVKVRRRVSGIGSVDIDR
ncbi:MAG: DUF2807 domain-containing protein [Sphingomonadales bacterium]